MRTCEWEAGVRDSKDRQQESCEDESDLRTHLEPKLPNPLCSSFNLNHNPNTEDFMHYLGEIPNKGSPNPNRGELGGRVLPAFAGEREAGQPRAEAEILAVVQASGVGAKLGKSHR